MSTSSKRFLVVALLAGVGIGAWLLARDQDRQPASVGSATGIGTTRTSASASGSGADPGVIPGWFGASGLADKRIAGTVFLDGKPAVAELKLATLASDLGVTRIATTRSGGDGRFDFGLHRAAALRVLATTEGAVPAMVAIDGVVDPTDQLEIHLERCAATVEGDVRDASGGAIARATVGYEGFALATTNRVGRYQLCLGEAFSETVLVARADGYGDARRELNVKRSLELDFDLVPEALIIGRVEDARHQPVAEALVEAVAWTDGTRVHMHQMTAWGVIPKLDRMAAVAATRSGPDGRFEIHGAPPGTYRLTARTDELMTGDGTRVVSIAGQTVDVVVVVAEAAIVHGVVVDEQTKKPQARVPLTWFAGGVDRARSVSAPDGSFRIGPVPVGAGDLTTDGPDAIPSSSVVAAVDGGPITVLVTRAKTLRGRVVRAGRPVGGADVSAFDTHARSRADGTFSLPVLAGKLRIQAMHAGAFNTIEVDVPEGRDVDGVEIDLIYAGSIDGMVVDQAQQPLAGARIELEAKALRDFGHAVTQRDGRFRATAMRGGAAYVPAIFFEGGVLAPASGTGWPGIQVADGSSHVTGVRLVARVDRKQVAGRVVDETKHPVSDVRIWLGPTDRETRTAIDGTFAFTTADPGPFTLRARAPGLREGSVEQVAAGSTVELVLQDPGQIEIRCDDGFKDIEVISRRGAGGDGFSFGDGVFRLAGTLRGTCGAVVGPLLPGRYAVAGFEGGVEVTVEPAKTAVARLRKAELGTVEVTAVGPAGQVADTHCYASTLSTMYTRSPIGDAGTVVITTWRGKRMVTCVGGGLHGGAVVDVGRELVRVRVEMKP